MSCKLKKIQKAHCLATVRLIESDCYTNLKMLKGTLMERKSNLNHPYQYRPVFIGGCDRSGTSMLGALVGGSPDAITTPESSFIITAKKEIEKGRLEPNLNKVMAFITENPKKIEKGWHVKLPIGQLSNNMDDFSLRTVVFITVDTYARQNNKTGRCVWVDHTPSNIKYTDSLLQEFPDAKFLHLVRDGRGVAASVLKLNWGPNNMEEAAKWWCFNLSFGLAAEQRLGPERIMRVYYEDLLTKTAPTLQKICEFCNIRYVPDMVLGGGFQPTDVKKIHKLVGSPPKVSRAEAWKKTLSPRQIQVFENYSAEMLLLMGYEHMYGLKSRGRELPSLKKFLYKVNIKLNNYILNNT
jgi:hypothetical protein